MTLVPVGIHRSVVALLAGAIDYAGTFPPARLSLDQAVANYLRYCHSEEAWPLGRFVCSASQLAALPAAFEACAGRGGVSVIVEDLKSFEQAVQSAFADFIEAFEMRGGDLGTLGEQVRIALRTAAAVGFDRTMLFFEIPNDAAPHEFTAVLRDHGAGLKVRTGGLTHDAFPTAERLAEVIIACRDHRLHWKATAGLHRPFRHFDSTLGCKAHGFMNLFVAAVLADVHQLSTAEVVAILDDETAEHFRFDWDGLSWCDRTATVAEIAAARRRGLRSFGSCSFTEPLEGLRKLGI